jgi:hypothetical protein
MQPWKWCVWGRNVEMEDRGREEEFSENVGEGVWIPTLRRMRRRRDDLNAI